MKRFLSILLILTMLLASLIIPVSADEAQVPEVLGASIRTEGNQGLRFIGRIKKTGSITLTFGESANFGFLLIPESSISYGESITKDTSMVSKVPAKKLMGQGSIEAIGLTYDSDYYYFAVVQLDIPASYYETNIVVKAYVDNGGTYTYSNSGSAEKRSIQYVAQAIADKGGVIPAFINEVLEKSAEVGTDIVFSGDKLSVLTKYPDYPSCIAQDGLYSVSVAQGSKNQSLKVYNQTAGYSMYDSNNSSSRSLGVMDSNRRFCEFAFAFEKVTVNIKVNKKFTSYVVSPTSKGFATSYSNGTISVTLDKPTQFVVILDDDYKTALAVFADAPETDIPTKGASNVVYVEGDSVITAPDGLVSYVGTNNTVMVVHKRNTKIYLAPGAVLKKRIFISRVDQGDNSGYGSKIYGRGAILDPNSDYSISDPRDWTSLTLTDCYDDSGSTKSYAAMKAVVNVYSYGFRMEDVKVLDARNFNVLVAQESGNGINNVKLLSTEMSTDGFMITGNHKVTNCFVYNGDNALVMTGGSLTGHYYENITIGTTCAAVYPQYGFNGTLKDIYVFRADDNLINVHEDNSGAMTMNIDGLDAIDCVKTPLIFADDGSNGSDTKTFNITNLVTRYTTGSKTSFTAGTYASQYNAMESGSSGYIFNFTNLYVGGHRIGPDNDGSSIKVGSAYHGANTTGGNTTSGMTLNFAYDSSNVPAHTAVPENGTANYTAGAAYVAGPIR
ncbi:MAG: hypothetical protein E7680_07715, partial [Ruminococcaceae bacterium]|nr:hypothetical protein [Oscillospiraceae bacterium]